MKKIIFTLSIVAVGLALMVLVLPTHSKAVDVPEKKNYCSETGDFATSKFCEKNTSTDTRLNSLITYIVNIVFAIVGSIVAIVIVVAGIQLSTSSGDPAAIKNAKSRLVAAITSLILLLSMTAIFNLIGFQTL
ncbi:hypothetical protein EXS66_02760 [Candidatus Saccharibacteria bacterium]|nr:hypothetical protein [Candidatus Saccharibacteria bacterium]